jgi:hypothetical protein
MSLRLNKSIVMLLMASATALGSSGAFAHSPFVQKDDYLTPDGRSYLEGRSAYIAPSLGHACGAGTGTTNVSVTLPSGDAEVYDLTLDPATLAVAADPKPSAYLLSNVLTADPVSVKPERDGDWEMLMVKKDAGGKVRALHWHDGFVPDEMVERLNIRSTFAKFKPDTCVSKVRVYMPLAQFCANTPGGALVGAHWWLWASVPAAGIDIGAAPAAGFTKVVGNPPYVDIDRDLKNNPLPKSCGASNYNNGDAHNHLGQPRPGQVIGVYPTLDTIKAYQTITGSTGGGSACPPGTVSYMDPVTHETTCVPTP